LQIPAEFRSEFDSVPDSTKPRSTCKKDPFWKVASIIKELRKNAQRCWMTGKYAAIEEQTIGF
jgi:hypothetical protein